MGELKDLVFTPGGVWINTGNESNYFPTVAAAMREYPPETRVEYITVDAAGVLTIETE